MKTITLTKGKTASVSDEDFEWLSQWSWYALEAFRKKLPSEWYACRRDGNKTVYMHKEVAKRMGIVSQFIDHSDVCGLNNQRSNLRACNKSENGCNQRKRPNLSSRFKGVNWDRVNKLWRARIKHHQKIYFLGRFKTEENAATAYNFAAFERFGEFALFNTP